MSEKKELSMDELGEVSGGFKSNQYRKIKYKCRVCGKEEEQEVGPYYGSPPRCCGEEMDIINVRYLK